MLAWADAYTACPACDPQRDKFITSSDDGASATVLQVLQRMPAAQLVEAVVSEQGVDVLFAAPLFPPPPAAANHCAHRVSATPGDIPDGPGREV